MTKSTTKTNAEPMTNRGLVESGCSVKRAKTSTPVETTREIRRRAVDAGSVVISQRSLAWERDEAARKANAALARIARFVDLAKSDTAEGRAPCANDWRNLFADVAAGLEAAARREALDDSRSKFEYATADLDAENDG